MGAIETILSQASWKCAVCHEPLLHGEDHREKCFVTLHCTRCGDTQLDYRTPEYFDLKVVDCLCPKCRFKQDGEGGE
jgi:hypothetical protein